MNQNEAGAKVRNWDTICFLSEIFVYTLVDKWQLLGQKVSYFPRFFEIQQNEMNSSWFRLLFIINNEQIEPNLNGVFANKYDKIQCWPRNFDDFQEISNSLISLSTIFVYNQSIWKNYLLSGFGFACFEKSSKVSSIFLGFQNIRSVKWIWIMNGKEPLFVITYSLQTLKIVK